MSKVYVIRAAQFYKIGVSKDPLKRLRAVQIGCPIECTFLGTVPVPSNMKAQHLEKHLHELFIGCRTFGEWFQLLDEHIDILLTNYGFCPLDNPYCVKRTEQPNSPSNEIAAARDIAREINSVSAIYEAITGSNTLTPSGRAQFGKLINKYGYDAVAASVHHQFSTLDIDKGWKRLTSATKAYARFGRHITDEAWRIYYALKDDLKWGGAREVMEFCMLHELDQRLCVDFFLMVDLEGWTGAQTIEYIKYGVNEMDDQRHDYVGTPPCERQYTFNEIREPQVYH